MVLLGVITILDLKPRRSLPPSLPVEAVPEFTAVYTHRTAVIPRGRAVLNTASIGNDGAGAVDCDSRRAVGPIRTIRGVYMTQLNRLQRLAALSAPNEWSFYV